MFQLHFLLFPSVTAAPLSASCYICSGLTCAPQFNQLSPCKSSVTADKVQCFFVAIDLDHIYRGCYEPNGTHLEYCNRHRMNYCRICRGQACNNNPIYQDTAFSCRQCVQGQCHYTDEPDKIMFRSCHPFFYGHVPRCFAYYYYGRLQYFFSCANAIPLAIRSACETDTFSTVCRYCDYPNCNALYFANFRMVPHYRFLCFRKNTYINCNIFTSFVPVMACYYTEDEGTVTTGGCLNEMSYKDYTSLVEREHIRVCNDDQKCNDMDRSRPRESNCKAYLD